jgi:hypothetical protein
VARFVLALLFGIADFIELLVLRVVPTHMRLVNIVTIRRWRWGCLGLRFTHPLKLELHANAVGGESDDELKPLPLLDLEGHRRASAITSDSLVVFNKLKPLAPLIQQWTMQDDTQERSNSSERRQSNGTKALSNSTVQQH